MATYYTEEQVISAVGRLSRVHLVSYIQADIIRPLSTEEGPRFRAVDIARLELLCDLSEHFDIEEDAIGIIVSLMDQLNDARTDLAALANAVAAEPREVRASIGRRLVTKDN